MAKKPSYGHLEQKIKEFEKQAANCKQTEEALRESEQRFRDLVEGSIQGILIHKNFKPLFVNRAWADIYGYTVDEILKMDTILPLFAPHEQSRLTQYNKARLRRKDVPIDYEYQAVRKDGSLIWVDNRVRLVNWQGEPAVQATIFDITERKRAQEQLRESQERFREMAELLPTIISELDRDLNLTYVNQAALETFGYSRADLEAGLNVMNMIHPDDRKRVLTNIRKVMRGKNLDGNEHRMLTKDGSELTALVHFRPIYKDGKVVGVRSTVTDITERKRIEQALREREVELEIKSKSLQEVNTALRVLLERRDEDKREVEKKVLVNVKDLVVPYLEKVKKTQLDPAQMGCIRVLESNLSDIVSPFMRTISSKYLDLTPTEIQVTDLIKEGTRNKDIAKLMNLSVRTVEFHRENIRKKFGLRNRKTNLKTHLLSLH